MKLMNSGFKKTIFNALSVLVACAFFTNAMGQEKNFTSVIGNWVTFDEKTQKASSVISIYRNQGVVEGKIVKTFPVPGEKRTTYCESCKGGLKNKPILGLIIIKGMQCENGACRNGTITDPRDGKVYHAKMNLIDRGYFLKVRGYVGIPLFGKSVVWRRQL